MKSKLFDKMVRGLFGETLAPFGFSTADSQRRMIYRRANSNVYHFILPDQFSDGETYDIRVFPSSPVFDGPDLFPKLFPDNIGEPTGGKYLDAEYGIGGGQTSYNCTTEYEMREDFQLRVRPALLRFAVPYLDRIQTLEDMFPLLQNELCRGFALYHLGHVNEGKIIISDECERLQLRKKKGDDFAQGLVKYIDELLA